MTVPKSGLMPQELLQVEVVIHGLERDLTMVLIPFTRMTVYQLPQISHLTDIYTIGMHQKELRRQEVPRIKTYVQRAITFQQILIGIN